MARPDQTAEKRKELLPIVARAFAELGYRRTTTAELARRCEVRENILYRLWPDKKAMFIAAIDYVYELSTTIWDRLLRQQDDDQTPAERILAYEARHHGEFGYYRIVFAGLSETDDPEVRAALANMYRRYNRFIRRQISTHRQKVGTRDGLAPSLIAWTIIGLGTVANIGREMGFLSDRQRRRLIGRIGQHLLTDGSS